MTQHSNLRDAVVSVMDRQKQKEAEASPELSVEEILAGFKRELRSVSVDGFGRVHYYYPLNLAERFASESKIKPDGTIEARGVVETLIQLVRNADGSLKFGEQHVDALVECTPPEAALELWRTIIPSHHISVVSAEKK